MLKLSIKQRKELSQMISLRTLGIVKCVECGKVFDLDVEEQAADWYYGHDCFLEEEEDGEL